MNKNKKIVSIIIGVIVLIGVFYAGMSYGKSQVATAGASAQNRIGQFGMNRGTRTSGGGFTAGQIISKDATSITLLIMNVDPNAAATTGSGSKIIFLDASTVITKTATGSAIDLSTGTQVSVTGTVNPDGSITAKSIQIRPQVKPGTPAQ